MLQNTWYKKNKQRNCLLYQGKDHSVYNNCLLKCYDTYTINLRHVYYISIVYTVQCTYNRSIVYTVQPNSPPPLRHNLETPSPLKQ